MQLNEYRSNADLDEKPCSPGIQCKALTMTVVQREGERQQWQHPLQAAPLQRVHPHLLRLRRPPPHRQLRRPEVFRLRLFGIRIPEVVLGPEAVCFATQPRVTRLWSVNCDPVTRKLFLDRKYFWWLEVVYRPEIGPEVARGPDVVLIGKCLIGP